MVTTLYLHASKESNWEKGSQLGLRGDALSMFVHACEEVEVQVEVNPDTGEAVITQVDGKRLEGTR